MARRPGRRRSGPEKPLSPSALLLADVVARVGQVKLVARQCGVVEGTIRHVLNGRWPPKEPVRRKMLELWGIPLEGWSAPVIAPHQDRYADQSTNHPQAVKSVDPDAPTQDAGTAGRTEPAGEGNPPRARPDAPRNSGGRGPVGAILIEGLTTPEAVRGVLDTLRANGLRARVVDAPPEEAPTPEVLATEAIAFLRNVLQRPVGADGRHVGSGISAANALLGHVHATTPKPAKAGEGGIDPESDDEDPSIPLAQRLTQ